MKFSVFSAYPKLKVDCQFVVDRISDTMRRAKACGVTGLEYSASPVDELDVADIKKGMAETGCEMSIIGSYYWVTGQNMSFLSENEDMAQKSVDTFKRALEVGAQVNCPIALGQIRGNVPDSYKPVAYYEDKLVEILKDIAGYAAKLGAAFTIEPENRFYLNWLNTSYDCARVINRVGYDKFKLTLDLKHMNVEEDITQALIVHRDMTHNIHFIDADNTMVTPRGLLDYDSIIQTLSAIRFPGWIVLATSTVSNGRERQDEDLIRSVKYVKSLMEKYKV